MKTRLDQLTLSQFIDLLCGDTSAITGNTVCEPKDVAITVRNIVFEYKEIADSTGLKCHLSDSEELVKARIAVIIFTVCKNLLSFHRNDKVRDILTEFGINVSSMTDSRLTAEVKSKLEKARLSVKKIEKEQEQGDENINIRKEFDIQTAALMAHFKFQIDPERIKASIYANLVARHNREIKAQMAAMKNR